MKKTIILLQAVLFILTCCIFMTGCNKSGKGTHKYTIWLYSAADAEYYNDYAKNPCLEYLLSKEWNGNRIELEFQVPAAGSEQNNYDTMISSGDYPTMVQNSVSDAAPLMYQDGMIIDLTDYVKNYMPNYYGYIMSDESLRKKVMFNVDGKDRILSITTYNESIPYNWTGMVYRRDWIVKYGTNPKTGEKFTGGYTDINDQDSWTDNVVFPSGGTDPIYISDWEWMFEIFTKAQKDLGISDSYSISQYYSGYTWGVGGLNASFGEGNPIWYENSDGEVHFGGTEESMRSYMECLYTWYQNGWLDKTFNERQRDMYYSINSTAVRQGKVGMWQGLESDLGGRLESSSQPLTEGIFVKGCAYPINDIYGAEETKNVVPTCVNSDTIVGTGFYVMAGADDQDLETLCTFLDYLYSKEGAIIRSIGLNAEQASSIDSDIYSRYGLESGAYSISSDGKYKIADAIKNDAGGLSVAVSLDKLPGYQLVSSIDNDYAETYEDSLKQWVKYKNSGLIWGSDITLNLSSSDSTKAGTTLNKILDYMDRNMYKFIKGEGKSPYNDSDWSSWCSSIKRFNYDEITAILQKYADIYPIG